MLSCSIWFSAPSFWMGGGLESRCVSRVYGADGAVHGTITLFRTFVLSKFEQLLLTKIKYGVVAHFVIILYIYSYHFFRMIFICNMNGTHLNLKLTISSHVIEACCF